MMRGFGIAVLGVAALTACTPIHRSHGWVPPEEDLEQILVGVDSRETVAEFLGSPSTAGMQDESGVFFVRTKMNYAGIRDPQVVSREVVGIGFDNDGFVANVARLSQEDGKDVVLNSRVTDASVRNNPFFRQLFRNLGRYGGGAEAVPN